MFGSNTNEASTFKLGLIQPQVNAHTRLVLQLYHEIIYQISTQNIPHKILLHLEKNRLLQQGTKVEREECKPTILYVLHHIIIVSIENE